MKFPTASINWTIWAKVFYELIEEWKNFSIKTSEHQHHIYLSKSFWYSERIPLFVSPISKIKSNVLMSVSASKTIALYTIVLESIWIIDFPKYNIACALWRSSYRSMFEQVYEFLYRSVTIHHDRILPN